MKTCVAVIRDRNQLTIPEKVRQELGWIEPSRPVCLRVDKGRLIVEAYPPKDYGPEDKIKMGDDK